MVCCMCGYEVGVLLCFIQSAAPCPLEAVHTNVQMPAAGLEIATILVPQAFLVLGSCANMIKGLSWMAGGSTRSVFNLSFVRDNNIAGEVPNE